MNTTRNVKNLMNSDIMTVADDMTTDGLARYLTEREIDRHIHRLVVTQGKEPVGIITSLDLLKVVAEQR